MGGLAAVFQLLVLPQYQDVEKIKTIGSTYMAATGLQPGLARQQVSYRWYQEYWPDNRW